jgi:catalase
VNRPHATGARTNSRDGFSCGGRRGGGKNYQPDIVDSVKETGRPLRRPVPVSGVTGDVAAPTHVEDNDFVQAGNLFGLMPEAEKERSIANLAGLVAAVSRDDITERAVGNFRQADEDYGKRLEAAVQALRG